jgi:hypothetical protein
MTYFGQKVRACLIHESDVEMTLLKLVARRHLEAGKAVSYKGKLFIVPSRNGGPISIVRTSEPDTSVEVPCRRIPDAVDRFIDAFIFEANSTTQEVIFHVTADISSPGARWQFLRTNKPVLRWLSGLDRELVETLNTTDMEI